MLLTILYSLGIIQAWLLAFFLLKSRHTLWHGNRFLAYLLLSVGTLLGMFLLRIYLGNQIPAIIFWPVVSLPALFGPFLYGYVSSFDTNEQHSFTSILLHCFPYIGLLALYSPEWSAPLIDGISHLDDEIVIYKIIIASYIKSASIISYLIAIVIKMRSTRISESLTLEAYKFLRTLIWLFLIIAIIGISLSSLNWMGIYISLWADYLELGFLTALSYLLSIYVLMNHVSPIHPQKRYTQTNLTESARTDLAKQLTNLMTTEQPYREDYYSARYLSQRLGISEQNLSELLALSFDSNFYQLSNYYRLSHFQESIKAKPHESLLDLALESGFTSKASFNRVVKSLTGLTPSQLKKQLLK